VDLKKLFANASERGHLTTANRINERSVIIYGAGQGYHAVERTLLKPNGITPSFIMDQNFLPNTTNFEDMPIITEISLSQLKNPSKYVIIVTQGNIDVYKLIVANLKLHTTIEILRMTSFYEYIIHEPMHSSLANPIEFFINSKNEIQAAYDLLYDEYSKSLFEGVIAAYLEEPYESLPSHQSSLQYLEGLSSGEPIGLYVGCGGYHGETLISILRHKISITSAILFEPDKENFKKMAENLKHSNITNGTKIILSANGLGAHSGIGQIDSGRGLSSRISDAGEPIQIVSLDSFLHNWAPDYITIDVEGSDLAVIEGAVEVIQKYHPRLAVSVYHKPEHLWKIILFLKRICPAFKYKLRNYSGFPYETILYASLGFDDAM
jgi:FkbM family methyltransferase